MRVDVYYLYRIDEEPGGREADRCRRTQAEWSYAGELPKGASQADDTDDLMRNRASEVSKVQTYRA